MINIHVINNDKSYNINLPLSDNELKRQMRDAGFSELDIWFKKVLVTNCKSNIEYVDRCINEFEKVSMHQLNSLSEYLINLNEKEVKEYNAILKYEYKNIKDLMDLIHIYFERNDYVYEDNVYDISSLAQYMIKNNGEMKNLSLNDAEEVLNSLNRTWKGVFDEYNNSNGFVACVSRQKINKRKEINEYRVRDWDGNVTIFKSDIITAIGVALADNGTLFKGKELLYTAGLNYNDLLEVYKNLTGRKPFTRFFNNVSDKFGIVPTNFNNERIVEKKIIEDYEIVSEEEEEEEVE